MISTLASLNFSFRNFRERFDLASLILAPYVLTISWQYFAFLGNKTAGWILAAAVSVPVWYALVALGEAPREKTTWRFWLIVGLPLLLVYLLRVAFPDGSFDVLNYHIFHSERALRGSLFVPGDFFPTAAPFNPTPDILTGLYRHLLGYRFGTIVNFLALLWTGTILNRLLAGYIRSPWLRNLSILFILCTEQILFQINNYMVDLLALPFLLEATLLATAPVEDNEPPARRTLLLAVWLGIATAFKLTNLFIAVPIVLVYIFQVVKPIGKAVMIRRLVPLLKLAPVAGLLFIASFAPFMVQIYKLTGNPVFPLYNGIFRSPFWPQGAVFDPRWGPWGTWETITWPVLMFFKPYRLNEFTFYSGRLSLGYILAPVCFFLARDDRKIRAVAFMTFLGALLWSAASGYIRYALYLELTSGLLLLWLIRYVWKESARLPNWARLATQAPLWLLLLAQSFVALNYTRGWEWSTRESVLTNPESFFQEAGNSFRDRSLWSYLAPEDRRLFDDVDVWIETTYKTSAIAALLKPLTPVIGVRMPNYFETNVARQKFADVLQSVQGKRMYTLTTREGLDEARTALAARGLSLGKARAVSIYYFSDTLKFDLLLIEVLPGWQNSSAQRPAEKGLPLADMAFKARLSAANIPAVMRAGQKYSIRVSLRNDSEVVWPGRQPSWQFQLTVGNRWLDEHGGKVSEVDARVALFDDLKPSETVELPMTITAPTAPGIYTLQLDAIQEGVAWFGDRGSPVLEVKIKVE